MQIWVRPVRQRSRIAGHKHRDRDTPAACRFKTQELAARRGAGADRVQAAQCSQPEGLLAGRAGGQTTPPPAPPHPSTCT